MPVSRRTSDSGGTGSTSTYMLLLALLAAACFVCYYLGVSFGRMQHTHDGFNDSTLHGASPVRLQAVPVQPIQNTASADMLATFPMLAMHKPWCSGWSGLFSTHASMPAMQQQQQQAPVRFPKIVHQTVKNKTELSCEVVDSMKSWRDRNPGYEHRLYDDADCDAFVAQYYPEVLPVYRLLGSSVERADVWRYLVLHRYGGVYVDMDVKCMKPIDEWNEVNGHDATLLLAEEFTDDKDGTVKQVTNFILAAMPCHPVIGGVAMAMISGITEAALQGKPIKGEATTLERTGPVLLTRAVRGYAKALGVQWPVSDPARWGTDGGPGNGTAGEGRVAGGSDPMAHFKGVAVADVRIMPRNVMAMGWETQADHITCEQAFEKVPQAYICHQYLGTWKQVYYYYKALTYGPECRYWGA